MDSIVVELVADQHNSLGEGPVWLEAEERLVWVDITRHLVQWLDPATGNVQRLDVGADVSAVAPTRAQGLIAAIGNKFQLIDPRSGRTRTLAAVQPDQLEDRLNEGKCDSHGRFWAGTMGLASDPTGVAALYRLNLDNTIDRVISNVTISNGLDWTKDDRLMYFIDTPSYRVDVMDFESSSGRVSNRRPLIRIDKSDGAPDGMTLDSEGGLWVALWGGRSVRRYWPDGRLHLEIEVPASQVSSCAFGGSDLSDLYITTAASGLSARELENEPHAGGLFRCRPGYVGRLPNKFRG